ncbi:MAG: cation transporter [Gammaproteobacteria bacterium]|jgi:copper chaperone|nr:cation transporter [Gammaproteobacteria bacterium]
MEKITLKVDGMSCGGCEKSIRSALLEHAGVSAVVASHEAGTVSIDFDAAQISAAQLSAAIEAAGFDVAA